MLLLQYVQQQMHLVFDNGCETVINNENPTCCQMITQIAHEIKKLSKRLLLTKPSAGFLFVLCGYCRMCPSPCSICPHS